MNPNSSVNITFSWPQGCRARDPLRDAELGTCKDNCAIVSTVARERKASSKTTVSEHFLCPISFEIMRDPGLIS
jgi:hypothetical protein